MTSANTDAFPIVCLNGEFLPAHQARVSIFDRGFLYGDSVFETLRVARGELCWWTAHAERLETGSAGLGFAGVPGRAELRCWADELIRRNAATEALLRLTISRGPGPRGYNPRGAGPPTVALTLHPAPECRPGRPTAWRLITSQYRLPTDGPLTRVKHGARLLQVVARAEADAAGVEDALLLDAAGGAVETTGANLFWLAEGKLGTPPLSSGVLPGITRARLLALAPGLGRPVVEMSILPEELRQAQAVFLTLTSRGLVEVVELDGRPLGRSPDTAAQLHRALQPGDV